MPALGMAQETGVIVAWRKAEGDSVAIGDPLFDVETDKTTMEVEATHAGTLTEIRAGTGADIPVGETIAIIVASGDSLSAVAPETATKAKPPPPTPSTAPKPAATRHQPTAPLAPSIGSTILASPKAKFEARQRGIDLRRLVDQGMPQPFHVADLDRLQPDPVMTDPTRQASVLKAIFAWSALHEFIGWAEEKTGRQNMRLPTLAAFAAAAFRTEARPGDDAHVAVSITWVKAMQSVVFHDPDRQGLSEIVEHAGDSNPKTDLALIDLTGTQVSDYQPPAEPGRLTIVLIPTADNEAAAILHFSHEELSLMSAARFLDSFARRVAEPAMQLL